MSLGYELTLGKQCSAADINTDILVVMMKCTMVSKMKAVISIDTCTDTQTWRTYTHTFTIIFYFKIQIKGI